MLWSIALLLLAGPAGQDPEELERKMARLIDTEREARGIPPFELVPGMSRIAREHSRVMAASRKVTHEGQAAPMDERIRKVLPGACRFGENVSRHYNIDYAIGDLLASPGHRANLLNPELSRIGIGIVPGDDGFLYITQTFAALCGGAPRRPR